MESKKFPIQEITSNEFFGKKEDMKDYPVEEKENKIENSLKNEQKDREGRFKYYYDKSPTEKAPYILFEVEKEGMKEAVKKYREIKEDYHNALSKNPELAKEADKIKNRIVNLGKKIGLNLEDRLVENDDVHLISGEDFKEFVEGDKHRDGAMFVNEIGIKRDTDGKNFEKSYLTQNMQHELIHAVTTRKVFLKENNVKLFAVGYCNYSTNNDYRLFQEGLTELTNQQLYLEENNIAPTINYNKEVILVTELIKDMSKKTGTRADDILAKLQTGMFEGEAKYLKIILDVYGQEGLNKIKTVQSHDDVLKVVRNLGLFEAERKINDLDNGVVIRIDINEKYHLMTFKKLSEKLTQK